MLLRAFELPKAYREVYLLKEVQGHNLGDIAATLGISVDTVRARLERDRPTIGRLDNSGAMEQA